MENPEPVREHHELDRLAGHFAGPERMHPSPWNSTAVKAEAVTDGRIALDGFAVVQDYEQRLEDGSRFAGHGVFRYDAPSDTYEMHWFDSTGGAPRLFRGGFADRMLVLTGRAGDSWQRLTYDFNLAGGYRFKMETSDDGNNWSLALEGDNFEDDAPQAEPDMLAKREMTGRKAAASNSSARKATARKTPAKKASGRTTAKKASRKKSAAGPASRKKPATSKATAKKASSKKVSAKKAGTRKAAAKKATAKKTTAKKATARKAVAKKAAAKKKGARKTAARKTAAGRTHAKKAGARTTASAIERKRRQGKASKTLAAKKTAARKTAARGNGRASGTPVSQKKAKGAAQRSPQMPDVKETSTRTGWHRTAAKGARMR